MPTTRSITYKDERVEAQIVVRAALLPDQYRREIWKMQAEKSLTDDRVMAYLRLILHPDLCSVVDPLQSRLVIDGIEVHWPLEFDQFVALPALPQALQDEWLLAARELNPQWDMQSANEKKADQMNSTSGSLNSISRRKKKANANNIQT